MLLNSNRRPVQLDEQSVPEMGPKRERFRFSSTTATCFDQDEKDSVGQTRFKDASSNNMKVSRQLLQSRLAHVTQMRPALCVSLKNGLKCKLHTIILLVLVIVVADATKIVVRSTREADTVAWA